MAADLRGAVTRPGTRAVDAHAVEASAVVKRFGAVTILDGLDLRIADGEFVALLGHSGSGKSTLLRILAGLDHADEGALRTPERRAVVFQDARLLPWARVEDNVGLGLRDRAAPALVAAALEEVGLAAHARAWPGTLSGGEAQRAALARALVREPQLLLLDEPFGALDALTRLRMHGLLRALCRRHHPAVLLVTHDVDEALLLADRVLVLTGGRLSMELDVQLPDHEPRTSPAFVVGRAALLRELGVDDGHA
jgi:sulfonate transport system ATP-binding protein